MNAHYLTYFSHTLIIDMYHLPRQLIDTLAFILACQQYSMQPKEPL